MTLRPTPDGVRRARPLLGTLVDIGVHGAQAVPALEAAFAAISSVHALMNRHDVHSDVARINMADVDTPIRLHPHTLAVLATAKRLHRESGGLFDCTRHTDFAGTLLWDLHDNTIVKHSAGKIDLGGIAKGYAVDCAIEAMSTFDIDDALVNAGGDMRHVGTTGAPVVLRHPSNPASVAMHLCLRNAALASSSVGGLSPCPSSQRVVVTGKALAPHAGASILAPTCMMADALTKVVLAAGDAEHPLLARHSAYTLLFVA